MLQGAIKVSVHVVQNLSMTESDIRFQIYYMSDIHVSWANLPRLIWLDPSGVTPMLNHVPKCYIRPRSRVLARAN